MPPPQKDPGHPYADTKNIVFTFHTQTASPSFGYDYYVSLPPSYEASGEKTWPLVVFLHGVGESQSGPNESYGALRHGIPKILLCYDKWRSGDESPCINIPRTPRFGGQNPNKGNNRGSGDLSVAPVPTEVCKILAEDFITLTPVLDANRGYGWNSGVLAALIDEITPQYRIDPNRIHLTGFSMGGYGAWDLAIHTSDRFATLMPICGGGDTDLVGNIKHVPHWVHHGDLDGVVPVDSSKKMVDALNMAGAVDVKFTRHPDLAHDSWTAAYNDVEVWRWMLGHRKKGLAEV